ncbi:aminomethyl-transferring glycine dehydrogenase subunit GcvPA [Fimbriimonas ginsengisoli]|uniref:Probable glycine dehydrogenase (decarboxylating) subunit 1 n=1 Tax=Fimbriimonas ginsengisoli Gsoil 348 TaxID=661478 RepID=A0A068NXF1_FIMGI|nr:aminomethyl-transferring glycine dehydrogenase subunit GcvPA [Fimbriimonas ginsengisoli]AIE87450.1 glycine dehydrogenase subunit 1 [Fimbriimonas ginsengisoli Gsoil 348]
MPYIPHTEQDRQDMLAVIGVETIDELFREIPANLRVAPGSLDLPPALDEPRLMAHLHELASRNVNLADVTCFLGAGIYDRYIPATVGAVISRGEFLTAYTPYQPEASQGYLQTIYEFQSMIAELYGMDLANASMYDGATSLAEAAIMATGVKKRQKVAVSEAVHPHYRQVIDTYCWSMGIEVVTLPALAEGATTDYSAAEGAACVLVQYPNFFGTIEDLAAAREAADRIGGLLIVSADPVACALLKPPGEYGADIVVGEGQPMGVAMGLGGPLVGLFACKQEFVRQIPGRIVGRTREAHGERMGYVMTLRTREQDIRREKATSNICTNEALMALATTVYMTALGKNGMRQVAESSVRNTQYAISKLTEAGAKVRFGGKVFGEFVLQLPKDPAAVRDALLGKGILAGLPLADYYPALADSMLVAVTELRTKAEIDSYAQSLREVIG